MFSKSISFTQDLFGNASESTESSSVFVIGQIEFHEFQTAMKTLQSLKNVRFFLSLEDLKQKLLQTEQRPDVLLIAQRFTNEFTHEELSEIKRIIPQTKFAALLGSWSEGEKRASNPFPTVKQLFWYDSVFDVSLNRLKLDELKADFVHIAEQPETISEEEKFLNTKLVHLDISILENVSVSIFSESKMTLDWLESTLSYFSANIQLVSSLKEYQTCFNEQSVLVWDVDRFDDNFLEAIQNRISKSRLNKVICLFSFLRWQDQQKIQELGLQSFLNKPVQVHELIKLISLLSEE